MSFDLLCSPLTLVYSGFFCVAIMEITKRFFCFTVFVSILMQTHGTPTPKLHAQKTEGAYSFFFFFFKAMLWQTSTALLLTKSRQCVQTVNSAARAGQHRDLPLLFWECVDCMTHALMYLSVSAPASQPAESSSNQRQREREAGRHVADHKTRCTTVAWDGHVDMFQTNADLQTDSSSVTVS